MGGAYIAAFILPVPTAKRLTDIGWEFESSARLPETVVVALGKAFSLRATEEYLGLQVYEGEGLKITAIRDSLGEMQNIAAQLRGRKPEELLAAVTPLGSDNVEIFIPSALPRSEAGRQAGVQ